MNVAVVGAGLAGLTCAWRLQAAGHRVVVHEREPAPGGRMATEHVGGFAFDTGANLMLDQYRHLRALAGEVGIGDQWFGFTAGEGGIMEDGDLSPAPESVLELLGHPGLSVASRLRTLAFALRAWRRREELDFFDLGEGDDELDHIDAWTGAVERCGEDVAARLVDPFVRTFHFHSARLISMKYFEALVSLLLQGRFATRGFRGYMEALPRALAAGLDMRTGDPIERITPVRDHVEIRSASLTTRHDAVVLATTAQVARRLLSEPTPAQQELLEGIRYSCTLMCSFRVPLSAAGDFEGIWVPFEESRLICNCANESCKGSRDHQDCVLTMGLHDEAARELMGVADHHVLALVASEWERLYPRCQGALTGLHVQRWSEALPIYGVGNVGRVRRFWAQGQGEHGLWLAGDYLNHPWLEGAVRCGEKVAAQIG